MARGIHAFVFTGGRNCNNPRAGQTDCACTMSRARHVIWYCRASMQSNQRWAAALAVHEATHHRTASTSDHVYGRQGSQNLARNQPRRAASNADNYMFFVGEAAG